MRDVILARPNLDGSRKRSYNLGVGAGMKWWRAILLICMLLGLVAPALGSVAMFIYGIRSSSARAFSYSDGKGQLTTWNYDQLGRLTNKVYGATNEVLRLQY